VLTPAARQPGRGAAGPHGWDDRQRPASAVLGHGGWRV